MNSNCKICGKPLSDPTSVEMGIGPVCYVKRKNEEAMDKTENLFAPRSDFEFGMEDGILYVIDKGGIKSVTNDMENVLADIANDIGTRIHNYDIMYLDSMGIWDGIQITRNRGNNRFGFEFFSINERDFDKAKQNLLNRIKS